MKNILILGGCGYIGSALYTSLSREHKVSTMDLEWAGNFVNPWSIFADFDAGTTEEYLSQFDVVILVAANSSVPLCRDILDTMNNNVVKFISLVKKLKKQKFIYASSSCVYGTAYTPQHELVPLFPTDGLTLSKTTIDGFMPLTDIEYYGLRFGSVNGWSPNMRLDLMINSMTLSAKTNKEVVVMNGKAFRPIIGTNDLCRSVEAIINSTEDKRGIYNVASFNQQIFDIGMKVATLMGVPLKDKGNSFTYNFEITSEKFMRNFNFEFKDTIESIVNSIVSKPINPKWTKREQK